MTSCMCGICIRRRMHETHFGPHTAHRHAIPSPVEPFYKLYTHLNKAKPNDQSTFSIVILYWWAESCLEVIYWVGRLYAQDRCAQST